MTDTNSFDITEKTDILIKTAFGFPSTSESKQWYEETAVKYNNYLNGEDLFLDNTPLNPDFNISGTIIDPQTLGLESSDFINYENNNNNKSECSIVDDSTGKIRRFKNLILEEAPELGSDSGMSWYKLDGSQNNILSDAFQFNYKQDGSSMPYLYSLYTQQSINTSNPDLPFGSKGGNWFFEIKSGIIFFSDFNNFSNGVQTNSNFQINTINNKPVLSFYKYIGRKGVTKLNEKIEYLQSQLDEIEISNNPLDQNTLDSINNLLSDVSNIKIDVSNIKIDVSNIKIDISNNYINISNILLDISSINNNINFIKYDLSNLTNDFYILKNDFSANIIDIDNLKNDISNNLTVIFNDISLIFNNIDYLSYDLSNTNYDLSNVKRDISINISNISYIRNDISNLNLVVSNNTSDISNLNLVVSNNTTDISNLNLLVSNNTSDISNLNLLVSNNTSDISNLKYDISGLNENVSINITDISYLKNVITDICGYEFLQKIYDNSENINILDNDVSNITFKINELDLLLQDISDHSHDLSFTKILDKITDISNRDNDFNNFLSKEITILNYQNNLIKSDIFFNTALIDYNTNETNIINKKIKNINQNVNSLNYIINDICHNITNNEYKDQILYNIVKDISESLLNVKEELIQQDVFIKGDIVLSNSNIEYNLTKIELLETQFNKIFSKNDLLSNTIQNLKNSIRDLCNNIINQDISNIVFSNSEILLNLYNQDNLIKSDALFSNSNIEYCETKIEILDKYIETINHSLNNLYKKTHNYNIYNLYLFYKDVDIQNNKVYTLEFDYMSTYKNGHLNNSIFENDCITFNNLEDYFRNNNSLFVEIYCSCFIENLNNGVVNNITLDMSNVNTGYNNSYINTENLNIGNNYILNDKQFLLLGPSTYKLSKNIDDIKSIYYKNKYLFNIRSQYLTKISDIKIIMKVLNYI